MFGEGTKIVETTSERFECFIVPISRISFYCSESCMEDGKESSGGTSTRTIVDEKEEEKKEIVIVEEEEDEEEDKENEGRKRIERMVEVEKKREQDEENAAKKIQKWWRKGNKKEIGMKEKIELFTSIVNTQADCIERMHETILRLEGRVRQLEEKLTPPIPSQIELENREKGVRVRWKCDGIVDSFTILVDNSFTAVISSLKNTCLVKHFTDHSFVQIRSTRLAFHSPYSKPVYLK